jgi:hypothetical protein
LAESKATAPLRAGAALGRTGVFDPREAATRPLAGAARYLWDALIEGFGRRQTTTSSAEMSQQPGPEGASIPIEYPQLGLSGELDFERANDVGHGLIGERSVWQGHLSAGAVSLTGASARYVFRQNVAVSACPREGGDVPGRFEVEMESEQSAATPLDQYDPSWTYPQVRPATVERYRLTAEAKLDGRVGQNGRLIDYTLDMDVRGVRTVEVIDRVSGQVLKTRRERASIGRVRLIGLRQGSVSGGSWPHRQRDIRTWMPKDENAFRSAVEGLASLALIEATDAFGRAELNWYDRMACVRLSPAPVPFEVPPGRSRALAVAFTQRRAGAYRERRRHPSDTAVSHRRAAALCASAF